MRYAALGMICVLMMARALFADEKAVALDPIVVTPSRLVAPGGRPARSVTVIDREALATASSSAVADALGELAGIDIRRRGPEGVQADLSIRGTTFEENSLLLDGTPLNDPQTGHFLFDVPLTSLDIDSAEILRGSASSIYGANAFGGVVNLRTAQPRGVKIRAAAEGGSFDYARTAVSATCPFGPIGNRFSAEGTRSRGYMAETWFDTAAFTNTSLFETFLGEYELFLGYLKKDFAAATFYSNLYPTEEEHTDTRLCKLTGKAEAGDLAIEPKLFMRRHRDKFALDANRPGWQTNYHTTVTRGAALGFTLANDLCDAAYGIELGRDTIDSTNMQTHKRDKLALYLELAPRLGERLTVTAALRDDWFSDFGWECAPSVGARYAARDDLAVRVSAGRAYRVPTFTDMYYGDAANIGSAGLRPESAWSYEAGVDYHPAAMSWSATYFYRAMSDTIDWTRQTTRDPWRAANIGSARTNGVELAVELLPRVIAAAYPVEKAYFRYTALDTYAKHDYLSKYALDYLKHQITAGVAYDLAGFKQSWTIAYKKRIGDVGYLVVDSRLSKEIIRKGALMLECFFDASNIFDTSYSEQSGVPMPGRALKSGARLEF